MVLSEKHSSFLGAGGGTRTLTHSRAADFESAASAISPLRLKRDAPHRPRTGAGEGNRTLVASLEGWSSAIELRPLNKKPSFFGMVHCHVLHLMAGSTGLEPATPGSTVQCANQLRHNPPMGEKRGIIYHIAPFNASRNFCLFSNAETGEERVEQIGRIRFAHDLPDCLGCRPQRIRRQNGVRDIRA